MQNSSSYLTPLNDRRRPWLWRIYSVRCARTSRQRDDLTIMNYDHLVNMQLTKYLTPSQSQHLLSYPPSHLCLLPLLLHLLPPTPPTPSSKPINNRPQNLTPNPPTIMRRLLPTQPRLLQSLLFLPPLLPCFPSLRFLRVCRCDFAVVVFSATPV